MIQILTPEQVRKESGRAQGEHNARMRDLAMEEERLVDSVNSLRDEERSEKARIDTVLAEYKAMAIETKNALSREIDVLEERKKEAMKPIEQIRSQMDERVQQVQKREEAVKIREDAISAREKDNSEIHFEKMQILVDREQEISDREYDLNSRVTALRSEEERSKESSKVLTGKWADFHIIVSEKNSELSKREAIVSGIEATLETTRLEQEKRTLDLDAREKQLADRYATLERSIRETNNQPRQ